jgi:hypothetical protein
VATTAAHRANKGITRRRPSMASLWGRRVIIEAAGIAEGDILHGVVVVMVVIERIFCDLQVMVERALLAIEMRIIDLLAMLCRGIDRVISSRRSICVVVASQSAWGQENSPPISASHLARGDSLSSSLQSSILPRYPCN